MNIAQRLLCFAASVIPMGCVTDGATFRTENKKIETVEVVKETKTPPKFQTKELNTKKTVLIPKGTLLIRRVMRPKSGVRVGPDASFNLKDVNFAQNEPVMMLGEVGVWKKVYAIKNGVSGWIHQSALSSEETYDAPWSTSLDAMPTVLAIHTVTTGYSFGKEQPLRLNIDQGVIFPALGRSRNRMLVLIPETLTPLWLSNGDVQ